VGQKVGILDNDGGLLSIEELVDGPVVPDKAENSGRMVGDGFGPVGQLAAAASSSRSGRYVYSQSIRNNIIPLEWSLTQTSVSPQHRRVEPWTMQSEPSFSGVAELSTSALRHRNPAQHGGSPGHFGVLSPGSRFAKYGWWATISPWRRIPRGQSGRVSTSFLHQNATRRPRAAIELRCEGAT
jgi:hypothetical protein